MRCAAMMISMMPYDFYDSFLAHDVSSLLIFACSLLIFTEREVGKIKRGLVQIKWELIQIKSELIRIKWELIATKSGLVEIRRGLILLFQAQKKRRTESGAFYALGSRGAAGCLFMPQPWRLASWPACRVRAGRWGRQGRWRSRCRRLHRVSWRRRRSGCCHRRGRRCRGAPGGW